MLRVSPIQLFVSCWQLIQRREPGSQAPRCGPEALPKNERRYETLQYTESGQTAVKTKLTSAGRRTLADYCLMLLRHASDGNMNCGRIRLRVPSLKFSVVEP